LDVSEPYQLGRNAKVMMGHSIIDQLFLERICVLFFHDWFGDVGTTQSYCG